LNPPNVSAAEDISFERAKHWSDFKRVMVPASKKPARGLDCEFPAL
jgi:hypothetical protein